MNFYSLGFVHTALAVVAMMLGAIVLLRTKGDRLHVLAGYFYAGSMLLVNATALGIYRLFRTFGPFHAFAIFSLITLAAGIVPAITKKPAQGWFMRHYYFMCWSVVGLYAAFWSEVGTRISSSKYFWAAAILATIVTAIVGNIIIKRNQAKFEAQFGGNPDKGAA